jgi:predicted metal-binding protein
MSDKPTNVVFVCTSCDHNKPVSNDRVSEGGSLAIAFVEYLNSREDIDLAVQKIACLSGCLKPCNVALRGRDRSTFRFSHVTEQNIGAITDFGNLYWGTVDGDVGVEELAQEIRSKLTIHTPPKGRWE